jgi:hypothetical protein
VVLGDAVVLRDTAKAYPPEPQHSRMSVYAFVMTGYQRCGLAASCDHGTLLKTAPIEAMLMMLMILMVLMETMMVGATLVCAIGPCDWTM